MTVLAHEKQIADVEQTLLKLKEQTAKSSVFSKAEMEKMEQKLAKLKAQVYSELKPWDRVAICRHPQRPHSIDYIKNMCDEFVEISGDRAYADDHAIMAGFATIGGEKFVVIGEEKGSDTESRLYRNFGMPHPEGYRKALRAMQLAAKFKLPVLTLLDTAGAYPGLSAEERGQGWAIAKNLWEMAKLETPIIVLVIGEGCSGGALAIGVGDAIGMLEHSYYSVISPEACASILWKDASKKELAASALKMHVEDLLALGVVDHKIDEPMGGAHVDPKVVYDNVKTYVLEQYSALKTLPISLLLENRYQKFRKMGKFRCQDEAPFASGNPQQ